MCFNLDSLSYDGKELSVSVFKNDSTDFAFYVLLAGKKIDAKWYSGDPVSKLEIYLLPKKIYSLRLFFRPSSEETKEEEKIVKRIFFKVDEFNVTSVIPEINIFESENIKITNYSQGSNITFVTFNSAHTDKTSAPFGGDFILSEGWNLISIHKHNRNQYQDLSLELFESYVKPLITDKKVYVYGTSLGGYSSLYFGGVINATIIAGSPMLPVHPMINHSHYKDIIYKHIPIKETIKTSKPVFVIYDPLENGDVNFIKKYVASAYPTAYFLPVKGGTHLVMETLIKKRLLKDVIRDLVNHDSFSAINRITVAIDS
ncbi:hypothetical protein IOD06_09005 [Psychrobacter sp. N25K4-3-2]|uniref:hypothetical protein n=1 Tax=Psychrobacter sp. N25K4-3-2 TaxID=2785026 RepID=UPI00188C6D87|nr:hypothetical protein [Psychrobacter sp. N25K4-3-2]MBF4490026.1 hypothetical protein [Psychrobacter sp. N25K4-3-2]